MNIGILDRVLRLSTGVGVVLFDYLANANWEIIFLLFGLWSVLTSVFGWCPFYRVFGVNTCPATFKSNIAIE
ncbi:MAG: YgaP family membrane protein [Candidatus Poseidoniales archaeon]